MKIEPHADLRKYAAMCHEIYVAYKDQGFTDAQALELLKQFMLVVQGGGQK